MIGAWICLATVALATATYSLAAASLRRHRTGAAPEPPRPLPFVSIIKPLRGLDDELEDNLESFFRLDYPEYEVVFSFARGDDPAFPIARRVADRHRSIVAAFVVNGREPGGNSKVNRLAAGARRAAGDLLLFSDGNVRVRPGFLKRAIAPFADPSVGLVSHLFRGKGGQTLGSRLECLHLNGILRPGIAALALLTNRPCVVGKSILIRRPAFNAIGEFAQLWDVLAEDYLMGTAVQSAGFRVVLATEEIDTLEVRKSVRAFWDRHRRWAILRRRLGGAAYAAELLASPFSWFAGAIVFSGAAPAIAAPAVMLLAARYALELACRSDEDPRFSGDWALLPLRDLLVLGIFWAALFTRHTTWRGRRIRVGRGTRIEPENRSPALSVASRLRGSAR